MEYLIAILLGAAAGLIDAWPMRKLNVPKFSVLSLFAQWVVLGLLIPFVDWPLEPWLKGALIAFLGMIPTMIVVFYRNRKALIPTLLMSIVLGIGLGVGSSYFFSLLEGDEDLVSAPAAAGVGSV